MVKKLAVLLVAFLMFPVVSQAESVYGYRTYVNANPLNIFEHTYACVDGVSDCYSFPYGTSKSGGSLNVSGWSWESRARCHAACSMTYGLDGGLNASGNGVCHQNTNRALFLTGAAISNSVNGYWLSKIQFGKTGNKIGPVAGRFQACWQSCGGNSTLATD